MKPMWFVCIKYKDTEKLGFFIHYGYSADEVMDKVRSDFFDNPNLTAFHISPDNSQVNKEKTPEILFPSENIEFLKVQQVKDVEEHIKLQGEMLKKYNQSRE